ncbi:MAG: hypothetical protein MJE77_13340 [Proteobacteria bacterium]|nr:hypothetical protein [Pseudomonadota bacterium]
MTRRDQLHKAQAVHATLFITAAQLLLDLGSAEFTRALDRRLSPCL